MALGVNENEYVLLANLVKVRAAKRILSDLMIGERWRVSRRRLQAVIGALDKMESMLSKEIPVDEEKI